MTQSCRSFETCFFAKAESRRVIEKLPGIATRTRVEVHRLRFPDSDQKKLVKRVLKFIPDP